jgi:hypothetical protein
MDQLGWPLITSNLPRPAAPLAPLTKNKRTTIVLLIFYYKHWTLSIEKTDAFTYNVVLFEGLNSNHHQLFRYEKEGPEPYCYAQNKYKIYKINCAKKFVSTR